MTFTVPFKPSARAPMKIPIIVDMFIVLLLRTGHGMDDTENTSSVVRIVV
jgi:hypothetical protein